MKTSIASGAARRGLATAGAVLVALAWSSTAQATTEGPLPLPGEVSPQAQFRLQASNGYSVLVYGNEGRVTLTVIDRDGTATYSVRARVSTRRVKARIGRFGRIAVRFEPKGEVERIEPPKRCEGKPEIVTGGVFVGTIRFRGERGYTRVHAHRARGKTAVRRRWRCRPPSRGRGGRSDSGLDEALDIPVLAAFTPGSQIVFVALGEQEPEGYDFKFFVAGARERRGSVRIERFTVATGKARTFALEPDLSAATVDPPEPFNGTASFARNADGSTSWSGPLTVSLPGAEDLPLTGPPFSADLAKPKTYGELLDLLGLPSLARL